MRKCDHLPGRQRYAPSRNIEKTAGGRQAGSPRQREQQE